MLGPADALGIGGGVGTVRLYAAFGRLGHRVGYRMQAEMSTTPADGLPRAFVVDVSELAPEAIER